jgi:hypothetical protein
VGKRQKTRKNRVRKGDEEVGGEMTEEGGTVVREGAAWRSGG